METETGQARDVVEEVEQARESDGSLISPERASAEAMTFDAFSQEVDAWDEDDEIKKGLSGGHKGLPDARKILSEYVTPEARKFVGNLRADYTRKTQELAKLRRELELEKETISREKQARLDGPHARAALAKAAESVENLDPYKVEDLNRLIEINAAKAMVASIAEERKALDAERSRLKAKVFIDEHPEMNSSEFKAELKTLLTTRGVLDLEDAYFLIKGKLSNSATARQEAEALAGKAAAGAQRAQAKATLVGGTVGRTSLPGATMPPKGLSASEVYAWYERNSR